MNCFEKWRRKLFFVFGLIPLCILLFSFINFIELEKTTYSEKNIQRDWLQAKPVAEILKTGDLILRHSRGTISNMLVHFSLRDSRYSHAGIISVEEGKVYVYHALGGEVTVNSNIRKETVEKFCDPSSVHSFGIYRLDLNDQQIEQADFLVKDLFRKKIPFDTKYDLKTDSAMYCTEFVYKVLTRVSGDRNYLTLTRVPGLTYVACDDLYRNKHSTLIYSYTYSD